MGRPARLCLMSKGDAIEPGPATCRATSVGKVLCGRRYCSDAPRSLLTRRCAYSPSQVQKRARMSGLWAGRAKSNSGTGAWGGEPASANVGAA